ncbi:hypothetical protein D9M72_362660 [compost metagenome]
MTPANWGFTAWPLNIQGPPTCTTQDLTVAMGAHKSLGLTGIGTTTPAKLCSVSVACPPGMRGAIAGAGAGAILVKIGDRFAAPTGVLMPAQGVIALDSSSTASGIGLQLKDASAVPLEFEKLYALTGYNYKAGTNFAIALQAACYQTGATVKPGTANAVVTFTLNYQQPHRPPLAPLTAGFQCGAQHAILHEGRSVVLSECTEKNVTPHA